MTGTGRRRRRRFIDSDETATVETVSGPVPVKRADGSWAAIDLGPGSLGRKLIGKILMSGLIYRVLFIGLAFLMSRLWNNWVTELIFWYSVISVIWNGGEKILVRTWKRFFGSTDGDQSRDALR
jgi:hypothetical protein